MHKKSKKRFVIDDIPSKGKKVAPGSHPASRLSLELAKGVKEKFSFDRFTWFSLALIVFLGISIYSNTFHASFHFDDDDSIVNNLTIRDPGNLKFIWDHHKTRFLTYLSFALNYHYNGLNVTGYHVVNLTVHIATSVLVFFLFLLILKTPALKTNNFGNYNQIVALFVSLIFLVHPLQTQGVTYIVQRAASLCTFFYIAAIYFYLRARLRNNVYYHAVALVMTICAMLSKPLAFTLPLMCVLCEFTFFENSKKEFKKRCLYLLPYLLTLIIVPFLVSNSPFEVKTFNGIKDITRQTSEITRGEYLLTQFNVIATYIRLLFLPLRQSVDYYYPIAKSLIEVRTSLSLFFIILIFYWTAINFKAKRLLAFGICWFFISLSVESGLYPLRDVIFEHRLYLPLLGFAIYLPVVLLALFKNKKTCTLCLSLIIATFSVLTYMRNTAWQNEFTLWQDVVNKFPQNARGYLMLGIEYARDKDFEKAISYHEKAIALDPSFANIYYSLGKVYHQKGDGKKALEYFKKTAELYPEFTDTYFNMALVYEDMGDISKAQEYYEKVLKVDPDNSSATNNLGILYANRDDASKATEYYFKALALNPNNTAAMNNLAGIYDKKGDYNQAIRYYQRAMAIDPYNANAYLNIAATYDHMGNVAKATDYYEKATKLSRGNPQANNNLAVMYLKLGQFNKAIEYAKKAVRLKNDYAEAYATIGASQLFLRNFTEARNYLEKAVALYKQQGLKEKIRPTQNLLRSIPSNDVAEKTVFKK